MENPLFENDALRILGIIPAGIGLSDLRALKGLLGRFPGPGRGLADAVVADLVGLTPYLVPDPELGPIALPQFRTGRTGPLHASPRRDDSPVEDETLILKKAIPRLNLRF